ncbi:MAG: DUF47 family protein [Candidatus Melainabacteria bacterium]|nr:DUF47 family protein [Candidatus Melainabacteria bacterium]
MKLLNVFPKEEKFYELLEHLTQFSQTGVALLSRIIGLENPESSLPLLGNEISDLKAQAKRHYQELSTQLCNSFITPFDREDIIELAAILYKSVKLIEKIKNRIQFHQLQPHQQDFSKLFALVEQQATIIGPLVKQLNRYKLMEVRQEADRLHELEEQADETLEALIQQLCGTEVMPYQEAMVRKDIYEMLEQLTDTYRDLGNVAFQIILKHS